MRHWAAVSHFRFLVSIKCCFFCNTCRKMQPILIFWCFPHFPRIEITLMHAVFSGTSLTCPLFILGWMYPPEGLNLVVGLLLPKARSCNGPGTFAGRYSRWRGSKFFGDGWDRTTAFGRMDDRWIQWYVLYNLLLLIYDIYIYGCFQK